MNLDLIANQFVRMGARFRVIRSNPKLRSWQRPSDYTLNIVTDKGEQTFEMLLTAEREAQLEVNVLQCEHRDRHLLLLVKTPEAKDRFLCGHDEREWFVAAVPGGASNVAQAKIALQPPSVRVASARAGLNLRQRTRRHNRAFTRQGEWFFVPAPGLRVEEKFVLRDEPISRGGGSKPHIVAEVHRFGGEAVYVCSRHPNGLTPSQRQQLFASNTDAIGWDWQQRLRNANVYARGTVRHPDHAVITLHDWHQVVMNTESSTRQMANVAFLD